MALLKGLGLLLLVIFTVAFVTVAYAIILGFLVYVYDVVPALLQLLALLQLILLFGIAAALIGPFLRAENSGPNFLFGVFGFIILLIGDNYLLFLGQAWGKSFDPFVMGVLSFPMAAVNYVLGFFSALISAISGAEVRLPGLSPPQAERIDGSGLLPALMAWAAETTWVLALGVVSGLLTAVVTQRR